jgi:hypothetical protein
MGQIAHQLVDDADRLVAAGDADVHVQAEDDALIREPGEAIHDFLVAFTRVNNAAAGSVERMGAGHRQIVAEGAGQVGHPPQATEQLFADLRHVGADVGLDLDHRLHQFGGDAGDFLLLARLEERDGAGRQIARFPVENLQLQLHSQCHVLRGVKRQLLRGDRLRAGSFSRGHEHGGHGKPPLGVGPRSQR